MKRIAEKFVPIVRAIVADKGDVDLFALFMPVHSANEWDVVISAPWAAGNKAEAIRYIAGKMNSCLSPADRRQIGRIVVVEKAAARLASELDHSDEAISVFEYGPFALGEISVERAFVILLKRPRLKKARKSVA